MIYVIAFLTILLIILTIPCIIMYKKLVRYENWTFEIRKEVSKMLNTMKVLDNKQMFEKDDEVGRLWEAVKETVEKIENFIIPEGIEEEEEEKEELIIE